MRRVAKRAGRPIAERVLTDELAREDFKVWIGKPYRKGGVWDCQFGVGDKVQRIGGADSMQALFMAIEGIRVTLDATGRPYTWMSPSDLGPGIPYIATAMGRRFEKRVAKLIDREKARDWDSKLRIGKKVMEASQRELKIRKAAIAEWEARLKRQRARIAEFESTVEKIKDELLPGRKRGNRA